MTHDKLLGKRILFISTRFFKYEEFIIEALNNRGVSVDFFDERPSNSVLAKGIIRIDRRFLQRKINLYYNGILKEIRYRTYDFLFVLRGEVVPNFFLEAVRKMNKDCVFIYYNWDSFANNSNGIGILQYFDRKFSFDNFDCVRYNLDFRPLFFINKYLDLLKSNEKVIYDLLFIGTAHSDRFEISSKVIETIENFKLTSYCYYYIQNKFVFFFKKAFDKSFKKFDFKKLNFVSLKNDEILKLISRTKIVLDINHPAQTGLTMRTFETLGAGKKLITTNSEIKKYCFYNEQNILVIDRENPLIPFEFFNSNFLQLNEELLSMMSIDGWINTLFLDDKKYDWMRNLDTN